MVRERISGESRDGGALRAVPLLPSNRRYRSRRFSLEPGGGENPASAVPHPPGSTYPYDPEARL